ncbi:RNF220 domain-containing protein [Mycena indigotica]|uniref:RNF220 domain-containing protein n=1 Tax=Mycena indigotica TaxID=2126181 RepID=A0A8H6W7D9_9AGAR|nr:RNF220 domain-containing protein [Mycena indigotica]KAF7302004.1 RNF220 domain-containing protein [Mycena indigotica]
MAPDRSPESAAERALNRLHHQDFVALRRAAAQLSVLSKDKKADVVFRTRLVSMHGTLNIYLSSAFNYTWRQASTLIAHSQGLGNHHARRIRDWLHTFLSTRKLPVHIISVNDGDSLLDDEDFALAIKLHLQTVCAKNKHFRAQDIVDFVASAGMQERLETAGIQKRSISVRTARRWLKRMDWRFGARKNGMYVDGHEREDVVAYRAAFVK